MTQHPTDEDPGPDLPPDPESALPEPDPVVDEREGAPTIALVLPPPAYESVATEVALHSFVPSSEPAAPVVSGMGVEGVGELRAIEKRLDELCHLFQREIRAEATREKVVDRLHAELQEYKQDLLLRTLRPVFIDLIQLHDDIGKLAGTSATEEEEKTPEMLQRVELIENVQQGIEDILYRQGVEPFQVEGDAFDPRRQRAVATQATDDPALVKTVAARHRKGFQAGDKLIRPEVVSVYALRK
ncbi:MAG: hypothetical protein NVSMB9_19240 [Isosphaeraceae bacterium]